ncbi:MAG: hypothetical protein ABIV50_00075 [Opitutus sp.]
MNAFFRTGLILISVFASVARGTESTVKVAGSRELRLAVVDTSKSSSLRDSAHAAFAVSLSDAIRRQDGVEIGVRAKCVGADNAAFNLGTGIYDAVLVLTGSLPRQLIMSEALRLNGTLGSGKSEKKVYLIFNPGDETLAKLFLSSFAVALTDNKFLDALDGVTEGLASTTSGSKVAATP